jgi:preprotein translocase subunit SecE
MPARDWRKPFQKEISVPKEEKSIARRQPNRIQRYFTETIGELRKVTWPTRKEAINLTIVVLIVMTVMSIFLGGLDFIFNRVINLIITTL